jgi:hypothetical protein
LIGHDDKKIGLIGHCRQLLSQYSQQKSLLSVIQGRRSRQVQQKQAAVTLVDQVTAACYKV